MVGRQFCLPCEGHGLGELYMTGSYATYSYVDLMRGGDRVTIYTT